MMKIIFAFLFPLYIMSSCGNTKDASATKTDRSQDTIDFSILIQEVYGGLEKNGERVVTTNEELQEIYGIINRFRKPGVPLPEIDFNKHIVLALFMGEKTTGGFSTEVKFIANEADRIVVNIVENHPKPTDNVTMAICQPFCFVKIPRLEDGKKVIFKKE